MTTPPIQFGIQNNYGGLDYSLFCHIRHPDGRVSLPESSLQFRAMPKEEALAIPSQPILNVGRESLHSLMDELWNLGIRPTEGHGSTGQLAATERHLDHTTRLLDQTLQTVLNVANASLLPKLPEKPSSQSGQ